jgi:hypothetical protein
MMKMKTAEMRKRVLAGMMSANSPINKAPIMDAIVNDAVDRGKIRLIDSTSTISCISIMERK